MGESSRSITKLDRVLAAGACAAFAALLPGCPNPNLYTTPRTLDPGAVQVQVAPEMFGASFTETTSTTATASNGTTTTTTQTTPASFLLPTVPSVGIRAGLADGVEIGGRIPNFDSLAADLKLRLVKGAIDVAVDPGIQFYYLAFSAGDGTSESFGVVYLHAPLLVGLNLSKSVSIVASPGFVYTIATASVNDGSNVQQVAGTTGVMGRMGVGFNIRPSKKFSIQPELTFMKAFQNTDALIYVFGLGLNFGAQPDYSDLDTSGSTPAAPTAAPAAEEK
jgi:hypothetical protein